MEGMTKISAACKLCFWNTTTTTLSKHLLMCHSVFTSTEAETLEAAASSIRARLC